VQLGGRTLTLVDDSYNANPDSVRAAIDVLAELPGPRLLVLGDMGEVGDQGPQFHAEVGDYARERGIDRLFTVGEQAAGMNGRHFESVEALNEAVLAELGNARSLLVKGSRFMKMERVVEAVTRQGVAA
jgi:UDP-N-acetylmuramoyl-tripeptide--D-alanyl-D-alanine ligase